MPRRAASTRASTPQIIRLDQNRVDVVFEINDGPRDADQPHRVRRQPGVQREPAARGDRQPRGRRGGGSCRPPTSYDPERMNFDKELLRRFYLKNGYADFEVTRCHRRAVAGPHGVLPDLHAQRGRALHGRARSASIRTCGTWIRQALTQGPADRASRRLVRRRCGRAQRGPMRARRRPEPRLCRSSRSAAHHPPPGEAHRRHRLRCRRGAARLCRAHRHRRQHPHQGQGDPPRIQAGRGRRVQRRPRCAGPGSACSDLGYFSNVNDRRRAGLGAGQGDRDHHRRRRRRPAR